MASRGIEVGILLVLVFSAGAAAQSPSPSGCTVALLSLSPCLSFVTGNSTTPSSSCCSQLGNVVQSSPRCLCSLLGGGGSSLGITINQTLALSLPGACKVHTPPVSRCNALANGPMASAATPASAPVDSPAASPSESTPSDSSSNAIPEAEAPNTPSESSTPAAAATGSKTVPSTSGASSSGRNTIKSPLHVVGFLVFILSYALTGAKI
ncbi:hypothetical protein NMG60_11014004 [Bertholletia excelsa]